MHDQGADHPLYQSYRSHISRAVCCIKRITDEGASTGTGTFFGYSKQDGVESHALFLTAGHVANDRDSGRDLRWRVEGTEPSHWECEFDHKEDDCGSLFWQGDEAWNGLGSHLDIGLLKLPLSSELRERLGVPVSKLVNLIPSTMAVLPGTEVCWAGYPHGPSAEFGKPIQCVYKGLVSAFLGDRELPPAYILDGNNSFGVSGGPVWHWNDVAARAEVFGVVYAYMPSAESLPGHVMCAAINPLMKYLAEQYNVIDYC